MFISKEHKKVGHFNSEQLVGAKKMNFVDQLEPGRSVRLRFLIIEATCLDSFQSKLGF